MAEIPINFGGGAGNGSDDCTATKAQVLKGYKAITKDSDDEVIEGTIPIRGGATITPGKTAQTIAANQYLSGVQTIASLGGNAPANMVHPSYSFSSDNAGRAQKGTMATLGAQTVVPGNAQKVVNSSGKYMTGNVTVNAVAGLTAANIKKGVVVGGVTGTFEGYTSSPLYLYNRGTWSGLQTPGMTSIYTDGNYFRDNASNGYMSFEDKSTGTSSPAISVRLNQTFNVTNYRYIKAVISVFGSVAERNLIRIGISTNVNAGLNSYTASVTKTPIDSTTNTTVILDVNNYSGNYYIYLEGTTYNSFSSTASIVMIYSLFLSNS